MKENLVIDPYYQFQDVPIRFEVYKDGKKIRPDNAVVICYGPSPDKEYILKDKASISDEEVKYVLKGKNVDKTGDYTFVFKVSVRGLGAYTHIVKANVKKLPVRNRKGTAN